ncbi:LEA type 2 family protein, partial [Chloroflexota bacterium]
LILISLVSLLVVVPVFGACAPKEKPLTDLVIKVDWVEPIAIAAKPYEIPKSLAGEYGTFHVILTISNPNDILVAVESLEAEVEANDIPMGIVQTDGPVYIPGGKEVTVRFPITLNSLNMIKEVVMQQMVSIPDGVEILLGTWKDIQDGTAAFQVKGGAQVVAGSTSRFQNFDLRWP